MMPGTRLSSGVLRVNGAICQAWESPGLRAASSAPEADGARAVCRSVRAGTLPEGELEDGRILSCEDAELEALGGAGGPVGSR
jgi:hypothetical protein